jgi:protein-tyrosine kinase
MGKIVDALKVAQGEVAELVLRSIEEPDERTLPETEQPKEPPSGRVLPLPRRISREQHDRGRAAPSGVPAGAPAAKTPARTAYIAPGMGRWQVRPLALRLSDMAPLLSAKAVEPDATEQYQFVRTRIMHYPTATRMLVVSSPGIGDGKTVTAVNLAGTFARTGEEEVLLVDADLRCSKVHSYLRVPRSPGLAEVLAGRCGLHEAIFRVEQIPSLCVLPAGEPGGSPTELLGSSRWLTVAKAMREQFDRVFVDCPPAEAVADYDLIAAACDGVLLIVRPDHTNRALGLRALEKVREKLVGVLLNCTTDRALLKQYMSHYYSRSQSEKNENEKG